MSGAASESHQSTPLPTAAGQGLALRTGFFRLDWTVRFTHTTVAIDGHPHALPWGAHFFPLDPGQHELQVSYRYLHLSAAGKAETGFNVAANQVVHVSYQPPRSVLIAFLPGKLTIEPQD